jgi:cytidylate kinase
MREKLIIIINGTAESGKDTLCNLAAKHYCC